MIGKYDFEAKKKEITGSDALSIFTRKQIEVVKNEYDKKYNLLDSEGQDRLDNAVTTFFANCALAKKVESVDARKFSELAEEILKENKFDFSMYVEAESNYMESYEVSYNLSVEDLNNAIKKFSIDSNRSPEEVIRAYNDVDKKLKDIEERFSNIVKKIEKRGDISYTAEDKEKMTELAEKYSSFKELYEELISNKTKFIEKNGTEDDKKTLAKKQAVINGTVYLIDDLVANNNEKWNEILNKIGNLVIYYLQDDGTYISFHHAAFQDEILKKHKVDVLFGTELTEKVEKVLGLGISKDKELEKAKKDLKDAIQGKEWLGDISEINKEIDAKTDVAAIDALKAKCLAEGKTKVKAIIDKLADTISYAGADLSKDDVKNKVDAAATIKELDDIYKKSGCELYENKEELKKTIKENDDKGYFKNILGKTADEINNEIDAADNITELTEGYLSEIREFVKNNENYTDDDRNKLRNLKDAIKTLNSKELTKKDLNSNNKAKKVVGIKQAGSNLLNKMKEHKVVAGTLAAGIGIAIAAGVALVNLPVAAMAVIYGALGYGANEVRKALKK